MTKNTYNVIWVDDEISAILNERTIELLESEDIRVIATATHADGAGGLEELLRKHTARGITNDRVDAVITDAERDIICNLITERGRDGIIKESADIVKASINMDYYKSHRSEVIRCYINVVINNPRLL